MMKKMTKRLIALLCIACMLVPLCLNGQPAIVRATDEAQTTTYESLKEQGYEYWTLKDFGIGDEATVGNTTTYTKPATTMDKSLFTAKIRFSSSMATASQYSVGAKDSNNKFYRFYFGKDATGLFVRYHHGAGVGDMLRTSQTSNVGRVYLTSENAGGVTLFDNSNLVLSIATEVIKTYQTSGVDYVDMKVGFYFDDISDDKDAVLYNNQYYYVMGQKADLAKWSFAQFYGCTGDAGFDVASYYPWSTEDSALEAQGYEYWTLSDVGINDQSVNTQVKGSKTLTSANKTVFSAKVNFLSSGMGAWNIGYDESVRFYISTPSNANNLRIRYFDLQGKDKGAATLLDKEFTPDKAGVVLRGNSELTISISVETVGEPYTWEATGAQVVDLKVGIFFNGRLYDDTYYNVTGAEVAKLNQKNVVVYASTNTIKCSMASNYLWNRYLEVDELRAEGYEYWTLNDLGIADQTLTAESGNVTGSRGNNTLDKSIFSVKAEFPTNGFPLWDIGYSGGFRFVLTSPSNANNIRFRYFDKSATTGKGYTALDVELTPEKAGVQIRGNDNLTMSILVRFTSLASGKANMQVGLYFDDLSDNKDAQLYNNQYFCINGVDATVAMGKYVAINNASSKMTFSVASNPLWQQEELSLRDEGYDYWTLSDAGIADQTVVASTSSLSGVKTTESMDKSIFTAKIQFPAESSFSHWDIGQDGNTRFVLGAPVKAENTSNLRLRYFDRGTGDPIVLLDQELTSEKAGVDLRGNKELTMSIAIAYDGEPYMNTETNLEVVDLKVRLYFNGKLYDNSYITIKGATLKLATTSLLQINNSAQRQFNISSNYLWGKASSSYQSGLTELTASDFGMTESAIVNGTYKTATADSSLDGTSVSMTMNIPKEKDSHIYIGGAATGMRLSAGEDGQIILAYVGGTEEVTEVAILSPEKAGVESLTATDLDWQFVFLMNENVNKEAFVNFGIYINGKLYDGKYFMLEDVSADNLKQVIGIDAVGIFKISDVAYEELTFNDFSILDTKLETADITDEKNGYQKTNYRDFETLDGTAFTGIFNFPKTGTARFSVGAKNFWQGFIVTNLDGENIRVQYVNKDGKAEYLVVVKPAEAGVTSLKEQDVKIRLTFDVIESANGITDMKVCVYINDVLYEGKSFVAHNVAESTMTRYCKLWAKVGTYKVESIDKPISYETYGFTNNWQEEIKIGQ